MISVAFFNNKGGVGKTTLLCNLAGFLAKEMRFKVLIVDADPQCNATQSLFDDKELKQIFGRDSFTLLDVVKPLAQGKGFLDKLAPRTSSRYGLDIVPGDPGMSLQEDRLATDWVQATAGDIRGLRTTFLFSDLLSHCFDYDYVFFDMGPSLGSINRSVLIAADFFLTPMSIDIFSVKALDNISTALTTWKRKLGRALEDVQHDVAELEIDDPDWKLKFAGYVTQQYTAKTIRGVRQPVNAFERIAKQIPKKVRTKLVHTFNEDSSLALNSYLLGSVPTLNSLIPMAQSSRKPLFALKSSDGVRGAHFTKVKEAHKLFNEIATNFISQVEALT